MKKLWKSIRRNPVINAFVLALAGQVAHDYLAKQIDWTNIVGYLSLVFIGVAAREFTVPENEHEERMARLKQINSDLASAAIEEAQEGA